MIYGGVAKERIQFNEQTLWTGDEIKMGNYQPFGDLFSICPRRQPQDYRRELSLERRRPPGLLPAGGVNFQREAFSSHPDQVMVVPPHRRQARSITAPFV